MLSLIELVLFYQPTVTTTWGRLVLGLSINLRHVFDHEGTFFNATTHKVAYKLTKYCYKWECDTPELTAIPIGLCFICYQLLKSLLIYEATIQN